MNVLIFT